MNFSKNIMDLLDRITKVCVKPNGDYSICYDGELAPVDGIDRNKIMPPTYLDKNKNHVYHFEHRYENNKNIQIVVLDDYASFANRLETAALDAWKNKEFPLPPLHFITVDVDPTINYVYKTSTLELPHRIFSVHFHNTTLDGKPFIEVEKSGIYHPDSRVAMKAAFLRDPFSILFGFWRSQNPVKTLSRSCRKSRCMKGEIVGKVVKGKNPTTQKSRSMLLPFEPPNTPFTPEEKKSLGVSDKKKKDYEEGEKEQKTGKPSEYGLGSVPPSLEPGGVSVKWIRQNMTIMFGSLYEYCTEDLQHNKNARAMLVCMGLYAHVLHTENLFLRSGCALCKKDKINQYLWNNNTEDSFSLTVEDAKQLYLASIEQLGIPLGYETLDLRANKTITDTLRKSYKGG